MTGGLAEIAQLGKRQSEDLKLPGSVPGFGIMYSWHLPSVLKRVATRAISQPGNRERQNAKKVWHIAEFHATADEILLKSRKEVNVTAIEYKNKKTTKRATEHKNTEKAK